MGATGLPTLQRVRFEPFEVDPSSGELLREGRRISLQEQPFQLLCLLLERAGQVVSREEIQATLWPKGTFVEFDDGLNTAVRKLRQALGDSADHPIYIETLPKRGYRFLGHAAQGGAEPAEPFLDSAPIFALGSGGWPTAPRMEEIPRVEPEGHHRLLWITGLAAAVALGGVLAWSRWHRSPAFQSDRVAVLPLRDLTGDAAKAHLPVGLTDELTTELLKFQDLRVTSRGLLDPYAGSTLPLREIAQELKVDLLVEGTLVRDGGRYHLLVNLVRQDGRHLWGERYQAEEGGLHLLQARVASDIHQQIRPEHPTLP
jgi:DNA-binding winged helix-turn-helix (wHTH) protein/TolB-like protein